MRLGLGLTLLKRLRRAIHRFCKRSSRSWRGVSGGVVWVFVVGGEALLVVAVADWGTSEVVVVVASLEVVVVVVVVALMVGMALTLGEVEGVVVVVIVEVVVVAFASGVVMTGEAMVAVVVGGVVMA